MFHDCYGFPQTQQASAPKNSNDMESDEDFDDEMMKVKLIDERRSRYVLGDSAQKTLLPMCL